MGFKEKPNLAVQHLPVFGCCSQYSTVPSFHYSGTRSDAANFTPPGCNQSRPLWSRMFTISPDQLSKESLWEVHTVMLYVKIQDATDTFSTLFCLV
jgi:hypothetical protein